LAVQGLHKIVAAESVYRQRFGKGYSPTLQFLGPPSAGESPNAFGAGLLDGVLAQGRVCDYSFTYTPGATGAQSEINAFTVTSEPSEAACPVCARFFTDETGVIRWTGEIRSATVKDRPLE
jgi:hypothetical protein